MSAGRKRNASHTWRAILHGRDALRCGLIKRIGDGSTVNIWSDPWILDNYTSKPLVRLPQANVNLVEELIDQENGDWDRVKIEANFVPLDTEAICRVPVGHMPEDIWAWKHDKLGNFSVRSAYKALLQLKRQNESASTSITAPISHWQKLWKIPVPPKVRNFWWRVIHKFVPCFSVL